MTRREVLLALAGGATMATCARWRAGLVRNELILCGWDEVFILSLRAGENPEHTEVWSWRASDCPNLPESLHAAFRTTDDCKPVERGRKILVSSSGGAVALVDRETKRAIFYATVVNAHSAELLPGGHIAAAASVSTSPQGNRLVLFEIGTPGKEMFSDPLVSAHGVVWDDERQILWALGNDELRAYRLTDRKGAVARSKAGGTPAAPLERAASFALPDTNGHDLSPIPGTPHLFVSTGRHCWLFDCQTHRFAPHDVLADAASVKSYSINPRTGRIAYVQAEGSNWWAERVHFLRPKGVLHLPGQRLYKARWNVPR